MVNYYSEEGAKMAGLSAGAVMTESGPAERTLGSQHRCRQLERVIGHGAELVRGLEP